MTETVLTTIEACAPPRGGPGARPPQKVCVHIVCVQNSAVSGIALNGVFSVSENLTSRRVGVGFILLSTYCMCVCTYVRTYVRTYVCTYVVCVYIYIYICMYVCMYVRTYVRTYVYIYLSIYLSLSLYIYIYIYILYALPPAPRRSWSRSGSAYLIVL